MQFFVTAIHTDSGKTFVSALLTEALGATYWKPIQSGLPRDTETVADLVTHPGARFLEEAYCLRTPVSPHASARIDGVHIDPASIRLPRVQGPLVVEGAGGLLVPLNDRDFVADVAEGLGLPLILVSNHYLGSINHTLLTAAEIRRRGLSVYGIIFNGDPNPETVRIILHHTGYRLLLQIPRLSEVNPQVVRHWAGLLRAQL